MRHFVSFCIVGLTLFFLYSQPANALTRGPTITCDNGMTAGHYIWGHYLGFPSGYCGTAFDRECPTDVLVHPTLPTEPPGWNCASNQPVGIGVEEYEGYSRVRRIFWIAHLPNCFDGLKSWNEEGVDCGGACSKTCEPECIDNDNDGYYAEGGDCGPKDCRDDMPFVYPGAPEICDGEDNDCDNQTDEGLSFDIDGDGHYSIGSCLTPNDDCNDLDIYTYQGAEEICTDNKDNNCNDQINEGCCPQINSFEIEDVSVDAEGIVTVVFNYDVEGVDANTIGGLDAIELPGGKYAIKGKVGEGRFREGTNYLDLAYSKSGCQLEKETRRFNIVWDVVDCKYVVSFGSDANLASGELTESINLFDAVGSNVPMGLSLNYQSLDGNDGPLGLNWSHNYNIYLTVDDYGYVALRNGSNWKLYSPSGVGYTSQLGDYDTLSKDSAGRFILTKPNGAIYTFGENNKAASIADRNGNTLTFAYAGDELTSVTDNYGRSITFYYAGDNLTSVIDPAGNDYSFSIGNSLDSITYPDGGSWQFGYQNDSFMTSKVNPAGNLTTYHHDSDLRIVEAIDPEGNSRSINYPETGDTVRTTEFIEKDGSVWLYTYDVEKGDLVSKTDPQGNVTGYTYDSNHNLIAKDEPSIGTTYYSYDANGNMTSTTDAAGNTTEYTYNEFGQVTSITNASDETTVFTYDNQGNLLKVTDPTGSSTTYGYDENGQLIRTTNATGEATTLTYADSGNVASVTGPDGSTTQFTYDDNGNRLSMTDAEGNTTRYEYDSKGQVIKVTDANGQSTSFEYDENGNRSSVTDANGKTTTFEYSFDGQMISMTDAMGYTTTFDYGGSAGCYSCGGGVDKLTKLTDAKGQSTLFKYDSLGNLTRETDPLGNVTEYGYDAANRVTSKTDPNGNTINYVYNSLGQLVAKVYPDGNQTAFSYDADGNLISAGNQHIAYEFVYDASDRLIKVTDSFGYEINYAYDAAGRRITLSSNVGIDIDYTYDDAGRLNQIGSAAGNIAFDYDELGRRKNLSFPNGVTTTYTYDNLGRLTDLIAATGASIITENHYTHDAAGNRLSNQDTRHTVSYTYDDIYRLVEAQSNTAGYSTDKDKGNTKGNSKSTNNQKEFYVYDAVGNRITSSEHKIYTHNIGNELLSADDTTYSYDANGNRITKTNSEGTTIYTWDYENRLIGVTMPNGSKATYAYDPFGRRILKSVDGKITRYSYDNEDILFETVDGSIGNVYIHGPGIDEPLALINNKGTYYYHADGLGSIVALTNDQAKNVQWYDYDSYGNQHDMKNRIKQPYGYTGREHDRETRLRYYRARYYDGEVGRFISRDPISFAGGDVNLFKYSLNAPTNLIDPYGLNVQNAVSVLSYVSTISTVRRSTNMSIVEGTGAIAASSTSLVVGGLEQDLTNSGIVLTANAISTLVIVRAAPGPWNVLDAGMLGFSAGNVINKIPINEKLTVQTWITYRFIEHCKQE